MHKFSSKLSALVFAGAMVVASGAHAAGLFDDDDDGNSGTYHRQSLSRYCHEHPYEDACDPYRNGNDQQNADRQSYDNDHCAALVRAVGKRNLITVFARNSARFAWVRETRFVHGDQYANWNNAHNAEINCIEVGALKSCVAIATPCRY
ncbi:MAG: hypothetical protein WBP94_11075 [Rhodomicrobiaceae bacterium]